MKHLLLTTIAAVVLVGTAFADPIHDAAANGDLAGVQAELDKGVDVNVTDIDWGLTPLHSATYWGHKEIAELLIAEGADVNAKDDDGWTPLDGAIYGDDAKTADLLRKHGGKSGAEDSILVAVQLLNTEAVKQHIAAGADVDAKNNVGDTPLHMTALSGHKIITELLIAKGADVNTKDEDGGTPLHIAVSGAHKEIAELLITNGADVNAKDDEGSTPLDNLKSTVDLWMMAAVFGVEVDEALWSQATELAEFLRKHGGKTSEELLIPHLEYGKNQWPFDFSFNAKDGMTYVVEVTQDFKQWGELETIEGTGKQVKFIDPRQPLVPFKRNFYRVKVVE